MEVERFEMSWEAKISQLRKIEPFLGFFYAVAFVLIVLQKQVFWLHLVAIQLMSLLIERYRRAGKVTGDNIIQYN